MLDEKVYKQLKNKKGMNTERIDQLICDYMKMELIVREHEEGTDYWWSNCPKGLSWEFDSYPPFDRSWDWLMAVAAYVCKGGDYIPGSKASWLIIDIKHSLQFFNLTKTYKYIGAFLEWKVDNANQQKV